MVSAYYPNLSYKQVASEDFDIQQLAIHLRLPKDSLHLDEFRAAVLRKTEEKRCQVSVL